MTVDFSPKGLPAGCKITYTITCPGVAADSSTPLSIHDRVKAINLDTSSTDAVVDDDEDFEYEDEEDDEFEYDDEIDSDELDDLDSDYEEEEEEETEDEYEYEEEEETSGVKGCTECNVQLYKPGIQGGYDPENLRFRDINGTFLRDP